MSASECQVTSAEYDKITSVIAVVLCSKSVEAMVFKGENSSAHEVSDSSVAYHSRCQAGKLQCCCVYGVKECHSIRCSVVICCFKMDWCRGKAVQYLHVKL
jgi:hypothetical protein